jgi:hypothetical protein
MLRREERNNVFRVSLGEGREGLVVEARASDVDVGCRVELPLVEALIKISTSFSGLVNR